MAVIDKRKKGKNSMYQIPTSPKKRKKSGIDDIGKIILISKPLNCTNKIVIPSVKFLFCKIRLNENSLHAERALNKIDITFNRTG